MYDPWGEIDRRIDIEAALDKMLPKYRNALVIKSQGYSYAEIARHLGIGKTTAYRYVQAGLKVLEQTISHCDIMTIEASVSCACLFCVHNNSTRT